MSGGQGSDGNDDVDGGVKRKREGEGEVCGGTMGECVVWAVEVDMRARVGVEGTRCVCPTRTIVIRPPQPTSHRSREPTTAADVAAEAARARRQARTAGQGARDQVAQRRARRGHLDARGAQRSWHHHHGRPPPMADARQMVFPIFILFTSFPHRGCLPLCICPFSHDIDSYLPHHIFV